MRRSTAMIIMLCSTGVSVCMNLTKGDPSETTNLIDFSKLPLDKSYGTMFDRAMREAPNDATRMLLKESALEDLRRRKRAPFWERDPYYFRIYQLGQFQAEFERLYEQASTRRSRLSVIRWAHADLERRLNDPKLNLTSEDIEIIQGIYQNIVLVEQQLKAARPADGICFWCSCGCRRRQDYAELTPNLQK